ncbi:MAG: ferrous iron transporter B [Bacilli bacterium]|nr:ferrous iron transporter B [Bacilli bacterium]
MKNFALVGNPNSGKTTLFNLLTGATAHVGNWPGVTVEKRSGKYKGKKNGVEASIVDLPGIYSLSPYTPEEVIARNYIIEEKPDLIIDIVDSTNIERNLYLTTQLLEMNVPVVVALNMSDALNQEGKTIDVEALEKALGIPVVSISALKNKGVDELMERAAKASQVARVGHSVVAENEKFAEPIAKAAKIYEEKGIDNPLFHAIKALENDEIEAQKHPEDVAEIKKLLPEEEMEFEASSANERYNYITAKLSTCVQGNVVKEAKAKSNRSDKIDKVLTNKWAGIPIFLVILLIVFGLTFSEDLFFLGRLGVVFKESSFAGNEYFEGLFWHATEFDEFGKVVANGGINSPGVILAGTWEGFAAWLGDMMNKGLEAAGAAEWAVGFIDSVVIDGLFAVIGFLPQILLLYLFFSILEDSGYMARVAFIFDRIFRKLGLSGRAFIPMLMGYGCGVPAMINTRTLNTDKERTQTIRAIAFFPCGAKMTLLAAVAGCLSGVFGLNAALVAYSFYLIGLVVAILLIVLMHWTTQREKVPPFIMELPAYHFPQFRALMIHIWDKTKHYLKKAATIIVISAIFIWLFTHLTWNWQYVNPEETGYAGTVLADFSAWISPIFTPMGFGNVQLGDYAWAYTLSSITGIVAKEVVPDTLSIISGGELELFVAASGIHTSGFYAFIVFNLMTIPCFASIGTAKAELPKGTLKWTLLFWVVSSYILGCITYLMIEWVWTLAIIIPVIIGIYALAYLYNRKKNKEEALAA